MSQRDVKRKECVTHHDACDCREAMHEATVAELRAEVEALGKSLSWFKERDRQWREACVKHETTIARQAKVIENLIKEVKCSNIYYSDAPGLCDLIEEIEKEGKKDEV
jgi:hypothetical protein